METDRCRPLVSVSRYMLGCLLGINLAACEATRTLQFSGDSRSGLGGRQETALYLIGPSAEEGDLRLPQLPGLGSEFENEMQRCRRVDVEVVLPLLVPIIGLAVEKGVAFVADQLAQRAERLEAAGQRTYTARTFVAKPDRFSRETTCLLVMRGNLSSDGEKTTVEQLGLVVLMAMERIPDDPDLADAAIFRTTYLLMQNAVALTGEGQPVDLALGFAGSAAREDQEIRSVGNFAKASINIPAVPLGEPVTNLPEATGLLALPPTDATAIELSVGVTESGSGVPSAKKARAEFEALAAAIGPALAKQAQTFAEQALAPAD